MDGALWTEARDALAGVAELSRLKGGEALDIYFLNSDQYRLNIQASRLSSLTCKPGLILDRMNSKFMTSLMA